MQQLRVCNLSISADGYVAGPHQGEEAPLGVGGERLHEWLFATKSWRRAAGLAGGEEGVGPGDIDAWRLEPPGR